MFLEAGAERSSGLPRVFHVTDGASNLIYSRVFIFALVEVIFFVSSFLSVLLVECDFYLCILENFSNGSCFSAHGNEFCPLCFLYARVMFIVATRGFADGGIVSIVM
jgi:hypothetical protein